MKTPRHSSLPFRIGIIVLLILAYLGSEMIFTRWLTASSQTHTFNLHFPIAEHPQLSRLSDPDAIQRVAVAGFFNDWRTDLQQFELEHRGNNHWQINVPLPAGSNQYKFVVFLANQDRAIWLTDPANPHTTEDSHGGLNSVISVPDYDFYHYLVNLVLLCLAIAAVLYFMLHSFVSWLLYRAISFDSKLILAALSIVFFASLSLLTYQFYEMRKTIQLGLQDQVNFLHLSLVNRGIQFDSLSAQKEQLQAQLQDILWPVKTRVERSQQSLQQITLSDVAIFDSNWRLLALQNRQQNTNTQDIRMQASGYANLQEYYVNGVFGPLLNKAQKGLKVNQALFASPAERVRSIETLQTSVSRNMLGFSNLLVPIHEFGQLQGYYAVAVQVKMYGSELIRVAVTGLVLCLAIGLLSYLLLRSTGRRVTDNLHGIIDWVENINRGDLTTSYQVETQDELQTLKEHLSDMQISLEQNFAKIRAQNLQLNKAAFFDHASNLPNRTKLADDLKHGEHRAILLIGLPDFERIADFLGLTYANSIISQCITRIQTVSHCSTGSLYRISQGSFALLNCPLDFIHKQAQDICKEITEKPFVLNDIRIDICAVAGIHTQFSNTEHAEQIIGQAEFALQQANAKSKQVVATEAFLDRRDHYARNIGMLGKLKQAIETNKLVPFYQPIIDNETRQVVKLECLARIQGSTSEVISPAEFLPAAIQSGMYPLLSKTMFARSLEELRIGGKPIAINMSALDIQTVQAESRISDLLHEYRDVADKVTLEITETDKIASYEAMLKFIGKAKLLGCKIALDDFGEGYSNFSHLLALQVDYIKIDGSIVSVLDQDESARRVCHAIVECAHALDIKTIAEYVHNETIYEIVKEMGIKYSQGYLVGSPSRHYQGAT